MKLCHQERDWQLNLGPSIIPCDLALGARGSISALTASPAGIVFLIETNRGIDAQKKDDTEEVSPAMTTVRPRG
jgi:hypothetical protein